MSDINDDVLCADLDNFALAVNAKPFNVFFYKTPHMLEYVLEPGYFNSIIESSIRRHDRIEVVANSNEVAEHATLAVSRIIKTGTHKEVVVSLLFCNTGEK
jgi:hypothetical protein